MAAGIVLASGPAEAAVKTYGNCTQLHRSFAGGVALPGAKDHRSGGGHAKYHPKIDRALYNANHTLDRDHDHIACEQ